MGSRKAKKCPCEIKVRPLTNVSKLAINFVTQNDERISDKIAKPFNETFTELKWMLQGSEYDRNEIFH